MFVRVVAVLHFDSRNWVDCDLSDGPVGFEIWERVRGPKWRLPLNHSLGHLSFAEGLELHQDGAVGGRNEAQSGRGRHPPQWSQRPHPLSPPSVPCGSAPYLFPSNIGNWSYNPGSNYAQRNVAHSGRISRPPRKNWTRELQALLQYNVILPTASETTTSFSGSSSKFLLGVVSSIIGSQGSSAIPASLC